MTAVTTASPDQRSRVLVAVSVETIAYLVILIAAVVFRVIRIGDIPLGTLEAQQALAARAFYVPDSISTGLIQSPITYASMVLSFGLMGASDTSARLIPMLAGLALVFSPILFRDRLGRLPALVASTLLALSPIAVSASRQVSGLSLAMLGVVLALAAFDRYWKYGRSRALIAVGIALGFALAADYAVILMLITLMLGAVFAAFTDEEGELEEIGVADRLRTLPWSLIVLSLVGTLLLASTLLFLAPQGLGALADQFGSLLRGITQRVTGTAWVGLTVTLYEPGLLVFGLVGVWLASQSTLAWQRFLAGWGFASLLVMLVYPGALPGHALWIVIPMAPLAGLTIASILALRDDAPYWAAWLHGISVVGFFGMIFASLSRYLTTPQLLPFPPNAPPGTAAANIPVDLVLLFAWVIFLVFLWFGIASTWDTRTAWRGTGLGLLALTLLIATGHSGMLAFTRADSAYEPLNLAPAQPGLHTLIKTLNDLGELSVGNPLDPSITVQGDQNGALAWALRDYAQVNFVTLADPTVASDIVITPADGIDPALGSVYVGQDFIIVANWTPAGLSPADFVRWLLYRSAPTPTATENVILWVREDIYRLIPAGGDVPSDESND
jgi:hypothetical protein